jgi:hypothetical protein
MLAGLFHKLTPLWTPFGGRWRRTEKNWRAKLAALVARRVKAMSDCVLSMKPAKTVQSSANLSRALAIECLEPRQLLSGTPFSWTTYLASITPVSQPSGDMPADMSQEVPLSTFTPGLGFPDMPTDAAYHAFVLGYNSLVTSVADAPTERPGAWGEIAAANSYEYRVHLDDNGMLPVVWDINWGDGSPLDRVASGTPWADHAYAGAGTYSITVAAYSDLGSFSFDTTGATPSAITADLAPVPPGLHVTNDPDTFVGQSFSLAGNAAFSFPNPGAGNYANFSYDIGWGDGTSDTTGTLTLEGDNSGLPTLIYSFSDTHTYSSLTSDPTADPYTLTINVANTDLPGDPAVYSQSFPVFVLDVPPVVSSITPSAAAIDASSETFTVNFSSPVTNVQSSDFTLDGSGISGTIETPTAVDATSGYADQYTVTVDNLSYTGSTNSGTLGLDLLDNDSITDANSTPLGGVGLGNGSFVGQTCIVSSQLIWSGTSGENWNSADAWTIGGSSVTTSWVPGSDAVIPVGVTSIAIGSGDTINANSITFLDNTTLSGGTIDLGTGGTTIDVESNSATIASLIEDTGTLDKIGLGTLLLNNSSNTFSSTEIDDGTVQLGATGVLGSTSGKLGINGGTLDLAAHDLALLSLYGDFGTIMDSGDTAPTLTVTDGTSAFGGSIVGDVVVEGDTTPAGNQTSISLQSSADPVEYGQSVTFTASVTAAGATTDQLTGEIIFYDGGTALGDAVSVDASGQATLTTTLSAGNRDITAVYSDDSQFATSTSADLYVQVAALATITDLPTDAVENSSVTLGSTVAGVPSDSTTPYAWTAIDSEGYIITTGTDSTLTFTPDTYGPCTVSLTASSDGVPGPTDTEFFNVGEVTGDGSLAFTSGESIPTQYVDVGQTLTLPTQYFTDPGLGNDHTAIVSWDDGTSDSAQVYEESFDGTTLTPGTIDDNHVYTTASGTPYDCTLTLSDGNVSVTESFSVYVLAGSVALTDFKPTSDGSQLQVSYTVSTASTSPFNIDIYTSTDGTTPGELLMSYPVTDSGDLTVTSGTPRTVSFTPAFDDFQSNYQLIAVADASTDTATNTAPFDGGIFVAASVTASPAQNVIYVFGTNTGSGDTVNIYGSGDTIPNSVDFDGTSFPYGSITPSITSIHVRGEAGNDTFEAASDVTLPLWLYGGSGNSTLDGGAGDDVIVGGAGTNVIHGGDGFNSPEIVDNSDTTATFTGLASNYSETGSGWSNDPSAASAYNGDQRIATAATGSTATWTFAGLTTGAYYDVYVTWFPVWGSSTEAQYTVIDPGYTTSSSLPAIDQTQPPTDDQAAGVFWNDLGVFQSQSGTLDVSLTSDTSGYAIAGAVRLVENASAPTTNLVMNSFGVDSNGNLAVTYTVTGAAATPFSIGIYQSTDGKQAGNLVGTIDVSGENDLAGNNDLAVGSHTLEYLGDLGGLDAGQYYIAKLDAYDEVYETTKSDNLSAPLIGVFEDADGSLDVLAANDGDNHDIEITQNTSTGAVSVTEDSGAPLTFADAGEIYVMAYQGNDTISAADVIAPMEINGGSGSDTIVGGDGGNTIYGGLAGGNTILAGAGDDTIHGDGDTSNTITGGSGTDTI